MIKLVRIDGGLTPPPGSGLVMTPGLHPFGRGVLLGCEDKRVSRRHGQFYVADQSVKLKLTALHENPCFVIKKGITDTQILKSGAVETLTPGDKFGLLPSTYWYELVLNDALPNNPADDGSSTEELTPTADSANAIDPHKKIKVECEDVASGEAISEPPSLLAHENGQTSVAHTTASPDDDEEEIHFPEEPESPGQKAPGSPSLLGQNENSTGTTTASSSAAKRTHSNDGATSASLAKLARTDTSPPHAVTSPPCAETSPPRADTSPPRADTSPPRADTAPPRADTSLQSDTGAPHAPAPDGPEDVKPSTSVLDAVMAAVVQAVAQARTGSPVKPAVKTEPGLPAAPSVASGPAPVPVASASVPVAPAPLGRERCIYGAQCYRRNPHHKSSFSHPSDADWGAGARGVCPWGAACSRRDPRHWQHHTHPPGASQPAASGAPRDAGDANRQRRRIPAGGSNTGAPGIDPANILPAKRQRRQVRRPSWSGSESENEYDMDDPFMTDGSEDDWEPDADTPSDYTQSQ